MNERTKRFKLTTDQVKGIRDVLESMVISEELLAGMLEKLAEKHAKKQRLTWESIAEMIGADRNLLTAGDSCIDLRINYLTSEVVLDGSEEDLEKHLPHIPFHDWTAAQFIPPQPTPCPSPHSASAPATLLMPGPAPPIAR